MWQATKIISRKQSFNVYINNKKIEPKRGRERERIKDVINENRWPILNSLNKTVKWNEKNFFEHPFQLKNTEKKIAYLFIYVYCEWKFLCSSNKKNKTITKDWANNFNRATFNVRIHALLSMRYIF